MRVITEERLREILADYEKSYNELPNLSGLAICKNIENLLINECQEIDQLRVTKLRPMCEAPRDEQTILAIKKGYSGFMKIYFSEDFWVCEDDELLGDNEFKGWIPLPIYKPEQS